MISGRSTMEKSNSIAATISLMLLQTTSTYKEVRGFNGKMVERDVQSSLILLWNKQTPAKYFTL